MYFRLSAFKSLIKFGVSSFAMLFGHIDDDDKGHHKHRHHHLLT